MLASIVRWDRTCAGEHMRRRAGTPGRKGSDSGRFSVGFSVRFSVRCSVRCSIRLLFFRIPLFGPSFALHNILRWAGIDLTWLLVHYLHIYIYIYIYIYNCIAILYYSILIVLHISSDGDGDSAIEARPGGAAGADPLRESHRWSSDPRPQPQNI